MKKTDFDIHFDNAFATMNQTKFEDWFAHIASRVYGADFELIKAGGKSGDKKCDGRRISTETVYQCYAPESPKTFAAKVKAKISDSFPAVVNHWPNLKEWILVHNNVDGLPPLASDKIEEVRKAYPQLKVYAVSRSFLKDELHDRLTLLQLTDVYKSASWNYADVKMDHIRPLLKRIVDARTVAPDPSNFGDIPDQSKLDFNRLSPDSKYEIRRARPHIDVVDRYLTGMSNPQNASIIQAEMRAKYLQLKDLGHDADEIMGKLLVFSGGGDTAANSAAAYVIVAYYLDACDIFENMPQAVPC
jgi:hypothetical protein